MHRADDEACRDDRQDGEEPGKLVGDQEIDEDGTQQREHRSDRQVDAPRDDDEGLADREQAEQTDQIGGVRQVDRRDEARIHHRDRGADHEHEDEETELLLQHVAMPGLLVAPTASCITFSSLNSSRLK